MSRVLIASWDGGGNTTPAYNLGSRLVRRGHRCRMLGWAPMAARAASAGIEFVTYPTVPRWRDDVVLDDDWDLLHECLGGAATRADVVAQVRGFAADVVVVDCMLKAGFDAGRDLDIPLVALVHVSYQQFVHVWGASAMGCDVSGMMAGCAVALALQPPGFDAACALPPGHEYVGAIVNPDTTRRLDSELEAALVARGDPWVLVSLSTTSQHGQREALQSILEGLMRTPVRVLVTLGGSITESELEWPANSVACGFVPHELMLPYMSAVVTHAGMSTIAMALAASVPMVCVPLGRDQGGNAERVVAIGAGLIAEATGVAGAVGTILADDRYRAAARRIAGTCAPLGGGTRATELIENVARASAMAVA